MRHPPLSNSGAAFDALAANYDVEAVNHLVSRWIREIVWERLGRLFPPGSTVLEIGCGTGEDALFLARQGVHVVATDAAPMMLEQTAQKAQDAGLNHLIETRQLDLTDAAVWALPTGGFDGVHSNYGVLNCIGEWSPLAKCLTRAVRPGGRMGFAVMGRFCLIETVWSIRHRQFDQAQRRWSGRSTATIGGGTFPVYYPSPKRLSRAFREAGFRQRHLLGLGVCLPPSDLYVGLAKRPRLGAWLRRMESILAPLPVFRTLGDHYWIEFTRC